MLISFLVLFLFAATAIGQTNPPPDRYEPAIFPAFGLNPDTGIEFGIFANLARFRDGLEPYAWRGQLLLNASVLQGATGTEFPYREGFLKFDWPRAWSDSFRLMTDLTYYQTTNRGYFGLGNDRRGEELWAGLREGSDEYIRARRFNQFDGITPYARVAGLWRVTSTWSLIGDLSLHWARVNPYRDSLLAHDIEFGAGAGQRLYGIEDYFEPLIGGGVTVDTRDDEIVTTNGVFADLTVRGSPGGLGADPYFGGNLTVRGYIPAIREKLSFAGRVVVDALSERASLVELARYGGLQGGDGPGGKRGVRGIPQGRLLGRTKLILNFEVRSFFLPFEVFKQNLVLGAGAFFDAGRVWTETFRAVHDLDGDPWRLHWGTGGGPRLLWGQALVIRCDIAYAPLGADLGVSPAVYLDVEQIF